MRLRADQVRQGDWIDGAEVVWILPLPDHSALLIALDATDAHTAPGTAAWTRHYQPEELIEVDDRLTDAP